MLPLTPWSRKRIGAGRNRTLTWQIKSLLCCRYTTTPHQGRGRFEPNRALHDDLLRWVKKSLGVESNHRCRHIRAKCFRYTTERKFFLSSRDGRNRTDSLVFPRHAGDRCPSSRVDLRIDCSGPYGNRTHLPALKGRYPQTDRRTSRVRAHSAPSGSGGARILVSWFSARC
jgi:hypothetical protein